MHLKELKKKTSAELVEMAEELEVEGASTMRRQDIMFAILKEVAEDGEEIIGQGTIEVLTDGFGFLRSGCGLSLCGYLKVETRCYLPSKGIDLVDLHLRQNKLSDCNVGVANSTCIIGIWHDAFCCVNMQLPI